MKPTPNMFSTDALAYAKLTGDIIIPNDGDPIWLTDSLLRLADELDYNRKDKQLLERIWLSNASTLVAGVDRLGQSNVAELLGVNQSVVSARFRSCKVVMEIILAVLKDK